MATLPTGHLGKTVIVIAVFLTVQLAVNEVDEIYFIMFDVWSYLLGILWFLSFVLYKYRNNNMKLFLTTTL